MKQLRSSRAAEKRPQSQTHLPEGLRRRPGGGWRCDGVLTGMRGPCKDTLQTHSQAMEFAFEYRALCG